MVDKKKPIVLRKGDRWVKMFCVYCLEFKNAVRHREFQVEDLLYCWECTRFCGQLRYMLC